VRETLGAKRLGELLARLGEITEGPSPARSR
jgi:hypothetical protein